MQIQAYTLEKSTTDSLVGLGRKWGVNHLHSHLSIIFSSRFRSSLGRCDPQTGEIRLASFLLNAEPSLLMEALTHEAAHAAVYQLHGRTERPHGPEWRELMRRAGFEPRARVPSNLLEGIAPASPTKTVTWQHQCPVCHITRIAHTAARRWRCALCIADGLEGRLTVTRIGTLEGAGRD